MKNSRQPEFYCIHYNIKLFTEIIKPRILQKQLRKNSIIGTFNIYCNNKTLKNIVYRCTYWDRQIHSIPSPS